MSYDNLCKYLSEKYPQNFARWLLGQEIKTPVEVLKTELSIEPIRADSVTFLATRSRLLHIEFQVEAETDPPLPLRMLDYWVRLYRIYRLPITQVLVLLKQPPSTTIIETEFHLETTHHSYQVMRMWEQDPKPLLSDVALLPLAVLCRTQNPRELLTQVADSVAKIERIEEQRTVTASIEILAGLRFKKNLIKEILRDEVMRESVIYQEILEEGLQQGLQQGLQKGLQQGLISGIELGLELKFGVEGLRLLPEIYKITDVDVLRAIQEGLKTVDSIAQLRVIYQ